MKWILLSVIASIVAISNINAQSPVEELEQKLATAKERAKAATTKAVEAENDASNAEEVAHKAVLNVKKATNISEEVQFLEEAQKTTEQADKKRTEATKAKTEEAKAKAEVKEVEAKLQQAICIEQIENLYSEAIVTAEDNIKKKKYDKAVENYRKAIELKPENAHFLNSKIEEIEKLINEPAILYIYRKRDNGVTGILGGKQFDILLDGVVVCRSKSNWKTTVTVSTFGSKILSATIDGKVEKQINIEPGGVYYLRSGIFSKLENQSFIGILKGEKTKEPKLLYTPVLELISKELGASEYNTKVDK